MKPRGPDSKARGEPEPEVARGPESDDPQEAAVARGPGSEYAREPEVARRPASEDAREPEPERAGGPAPDGGKARDGSRVPIRPRLLALAAVVALALGAGAALIGQQLVSSLHAPHVRKRPASTAATSTAQPGFVAFKDPGGVFQGVYPASWQRLPSSDPSVVLLAQSNDGASFQVRETQLAAPVTAANLGAARKLTDSIVKGGPHVALIRQPQQIVLGGLPGYLYLYTFDDRTTGQSGAHAHYFLFRGTTMITLVFQALPAPSIDTLAPLFDRVAGMFRALPAA